MNTPIITYNKWWHRFVPYYRKHIKVMNLILSNNSEETGIEVERHIQDFILHGRTKIGDEWYEYTGK